MPSFHETIEALKAAYGPAAAVVIFALIVATITLYRALTRSQEARIRDRGVNGEMQAAAAVADAKVAMAVSSLAERVGRMEQAISTQNAVSEAILRMVTGKGVSP